MEDSVENLAKVKVDNLHHGLLSLSPDARLLNLIPGYIIQLHSHEDNCLRKIKYFDDIGVSRKLFHMLAGLHEVYMFKIYNSRSLSEIQDILSIDMLF